jgi:hypothetical protein
MFENRALKRIREPKIEVMAGGWRRLHNGKLHVLTSSQNVITVIKPRRLRWETCSKHGGMGHTNEILVENLKQTTWET